MAELDDLLDTFDEAATGNGPRPRPTLADGGAQFRRSSVGRSSGDHSFGLDDDAWSRWGEGANTVLARCRDRGYEPTLHPEAGTYVEAGWEIDRALEVSDFGLCLESGHQLVGGGDPLATLERWGDRINHVHIKDARQDVIDRIVAGSMPVESIWQERAFCDLGDGDVPVAEILAPPEGDGLLRLAGRGAGHHARTRRPRRGAGRAGREPRRAARQRLSEGVNRSSNGMIRSRHAGGDTNPPDMPAVG